MKRSLDVKFNIWLKTFLNFYLKKKKKEKKEKRKKRKKKLL